MFNLKSNGKRHSDSSYKNGTYKITKNVFQIIFFSLTDVQGVLHSIYLMVTGHKGLVDLEKLLDVSFYPDYMMKDSCFVSYYAIGVYKIYLALDREFFSRKKALIYLLYLYIDDF